MIRRNRLFPFLIITLRVTIIKWPFLSFFKDCYGGHQMVKQH